MADIKIAGRIKAGAADNIAGYASEILFDDEASNKTVKEKLEGKQDTLTFDNAPTANSNNPVKSGGIKTALDAKQNTISTVNVSVDNNTGTPSGSASVSGSTLSLSFQNLKGATGATGATGPQGPQGERGLPGESGVTGDVSGFTVIQTIDPSATYGATDIAGAATVQATNQELTELAGDVALGAVYDVSAKNPTAGPNNDGKWESLSALLSDANLNTLIPTAVRKGGMSVKFVQSSDNKYIRYNLIADEFTTDVTKWAIAEEGVYVDNPEFIYVKTDAEGKILWAVKTDGTIYYGAGVPQQVKDLLNEKVDKIEGKSLSTNDYTDDEKEIINSFSLIENSEYLDVETDAEGKVLGGRKTDGTKFENMPQENPICVNSYNNNPDWLELKTDNENKILWAIKRDGTVFFGAGCPPQIKEWVEEWVKEWVLINVGLRGKKIVCFGDSVTEFTLEGKGWIEYLNELSGSTAIRGAIGGTRIVPRGTATANPSTVSEAYCGLDIYNIANSWATNNYVIADACVEWLKVNDGHNYTTILSNLKNNPIGNTDQVIIFGGANDFTGGSSIHDFEEKLKEIVAILLTGNPKLKIFILTPIVKYVSNTRDDSHWSDNYERGDGLTLVDFVDVTIESSKAIHIPVCDLYRTLGWNRVNFSEYFFDNDSSHPYKGFKVLAEKIYSFLK